MTKTQALNDIQELIDRSKQDVIVAQDDHFTEWKRDASVVLRQVFGDDSVEVNELAKVRYTPMIYGDFTTKQDILEMRYLGVKKAQAILQSMIKQIEKYGAKGLTQKEIASQEATNSDITENSRERNICLIQELIDEGKQLAKQSPLLLDSNQMDSWVIKAKSVIKAALSATELEEFAKINFSPSFSNITTREGVSRLKQVMSRQPALRESLAKLEAWLWTYQNLNPDETNLPTTNYPTIKSMQTNKVFIVHGHDKVTRLKVRAFLTELGLEPVTLQEQANSGQTIIEKFEAKSQDIGFAVILLTADDEGRKKGTEQLSARARQNVIFELGYFSHALGRGRVFCLKDDSVEIPSDYSGVVYESLDPKGAWGSRLAQELEAAKIPITQGNLLKALAAIQ